MSRDFRMYTVRRRNDGLRCGRQSRVWKYCDGTQASEKGRTKAESTTTISGSPINFSGHRHKKILAIGNRASIAGRTLWVVVSTVVAVNFAA
jgi:hypothetical protein